MITLVLQGMMEILPDRCVAIAKKELMYTGTVGLACWLAGIVFINRQKKSDAKSVMTEAAQTMLKENVSTCYKTIMYPFASLDIKNL